MGCLGFLQDILNVCRSVSDVLHILLYVSFAVVAALYALYKSDKESYFTYFYYPMLIKFPNLFSKINYLLAIYRGSRSKTAPKVSVKSNRRHYRNRKK